MNNTSGRACIPELKENKLDFLAMVANVRGGGWRERESAERTRNRFWAMKFASSSGEEEI